MYEVQDGFVWKDVDAALEGVQGLYRLVLDAKIAALVGRRVRFDDGGEAVIEQAYPVFGDNGVVPEWEVDVTVDGTTFSVPLDEVMLVEDEPSDETD